MDSILRRLFFGKVTSSFRERIYPLCCFARSLQPVQTVNTLPKETEQIGKLDLFALNLHSLLTSRDESRFGIRIEVDKFFPRSSPVMTSQAGDRRPSPKVRSRGGVTPAARRPATSSRGRSDR